MERDRENKTEEKEKVIQTKPSGISYSGSVTVKLSKGHKAPYKVIEKHNLGTADFFVFILNCIRGNNVPKDRPYYMQLWNRDFTRKAVSVDFILRPDSLPRIIRQSDSLEDDMAQVAFNVFIADNYISGKEFQGIKITTRDGLEYARIVLDDLIIVDGRNTNVAIDWVITLGNIPEYLEV